MSPKTALAIAVAAATLAAPKAQVTDTELKTAIARLEITLEARRNERNIPGMSAAIAHGQSLVWTHGFGTADLSTGRAATPETLYHLCSLTKPFAAAVLVQLVGEGKLSLDTPVATFGIDLPRVTVRQLLTHTSERGPGEGYAYSGNRFSQLDKVIEHVTGRSFAQEVYHRILQPLELKDMAANPLLPEACRQTGHEPDDVLKRLAQGYQPEGEDPVAYPARFSSAAGLVGSAGDVARFSMALDAHRVLSPALTTLALTPAKSTTGRTLPYALGWFVQPRPQPIVWHYGLWVGASALIVKLPEKKLTFVLMANSDALTRGDDLGRDDNVRRSPFAKDFLEAFAR